MESTVKVGSKGKSRSQEEAQQVAPLKYPGCCIHCRCPLTKLKGERRKVCVRCNGGLTGKAAERHTLLVRLGREGVKERDHQQYLKHREAKIQAMREYRRLHGDEIRQRKKELYRLKKEGKGNVES